MAPKARSILKLPTSFSLSRQASRSLRASSLSRSWKNQGKKVEMTPKSIGFSLNPDFAQQIGVLFLFLSLFMVLHYSWLIGSVLMAICAQLPLTLTQMTLTCGSIAWPSETQKATPPGCSCRNKRPLKVSIYFQNYWLMRLPARKQALMPWTLDCYLVSSISGKNPGKDPFPCQHLGQLQQSSEGKVSTLC